MIIFLAKYLIVVSLLLVFGAWAMRDRVKQVEQWTVFALTVVFTGILGKLANLVYVHDRPFVIYGVAPLVAHAADNSFPSDHTLLAAGIAAGLWFVSRRWSVVAWVVAIMVAVGRVLALVHWPMDVIGSMVIALVGGMGGKLMLNPVRRIIETKKEELEKPLS